MNITINKESLIDFVERFYTLGWNDSTSLDIKPLIREEIASGIDLIGVDSSLIKELNKL